MDERKITVTAGSVLVTATLNDSSTAEALWNALPLEASANTWGDEIYFRVAIQVDEEDGASDVVDMGALATGRLVRRCACFSGRRLRAEAMRYGQRAR